MIILVFIISLVSQHICEYNIGTSNKPSNKINIYQ